MNVKEGISEFISIEEETGLFIPVVWSKSDIEDLYDTTIGDDQWSQVTRQVGEYGGYSSMVAESIYDLLD